MAVVHDLIKAWEGIEDGDPSTVNLDPYICPAGHPTIGWGTLVKTPDGTPVVTIAAARRVYPNGITLAEAEAFLNRDIESMQAAILRDGGRFLLRWRTLSEAQQAALVSITYNIGTGGFAASTLKRMIENGAMPGPLAGLDINKEFQASKTGQPIATIAGAFLAWNKSNQRQGGRWVKKWTRGLARRRAAEALIFYGETVPAALARAQALV